jgi:hypothetical protein
MEEEMNEFLSQSSLTITKKLHESFPT